MKEPKSWTFEDYAKEAMRTADEIEKVEFTMAMTGLGLAGEGSEVLDETFKLFLPIIFAAKISKHTGGIADYLKKVLSHGHELDLDKLEKEIGDVQWYIARLCEALNIPHWRPPFKNIEKLKKRYPDGFSSEHSLNRKDEQ